MILLLFQCAVLEPSRLHTAVIRAERSVVLVRDPEVICALKTCLRPCEERFWVIGSPYRSGRSDASCKVKCLGLER